MNSRGSAGTEADEDSDSDFVLPPEDVAVERSMEEESQPLGEKYKVLFPATSVKINSAFSLNKAHSVFSSFVGEKKDLIKSIGFGGMLSLHNFPKISRRLAFWILLNLDSVTGAVVLRPDIKVEISEFDVHLVLGLPWKQGVFGCPDISDSRALEVVKDILGVGKNSEISMDYVESILTRDYVGRMSTKEKNAFKVAAVLFADAHLFAPKSGPAKVNHYILPYVADPNCIQEINWSSYVLSIVKEASLKVKQCVLDEKKCVSLDCCLIFLKVFYLDNLDVGSTRTSNMCLPRVSDFPYMKVRSIISQDQSSSKDGQFVLFGKMKIRPRDQVFYSWGTRKLDRIPEEHGVEKEEVPNFVMHKMLEFKADLQSYTTAYLEQVCRLAKDLDSSVCEYYKHYGTSVCSPNNWSRYALAVNSMDVGSSESELTPGSLVKASKCVPSTPIYVDSCSSDPIKVGAKDNLTSAGCGTGGYSAGPAFDHSGGSSSEAISGFSSIAKKFSSVTISPRGCGFMDDPPYDDGLEF